MVDTIRPRLYLWSDKGAPSLTGAPGSMISLLTACLIDGYNETSVTQAEYSEGVITLQVGADHGFRKYQWIEVSGADQSDYNGIFEVSEKLSESIKYEIDGSPSTPATGTITVKAVGAGWEKSHESTDGLRCCFKQTPLDSTQHYLYLDDTNEGVTRRTKVRGYKTILDIDTRQDPFPYSGDGEVWIWWYKGDDESTARRWAVIADDRFFWINNIYNTDYDDAGDWRLNAFGDIITFVPNDQWYCVIQGSANASDSDYEGYLFTTNYRPYEHTSLYGAYGSHYARSFDGQYIGTGLPGAVFANLGASSWYYNTGGSRSITCPGAHGIRHPSPVDGGTIIQKLFAREGYRDKSLLRGEVPGIYAPFHPNPFQELEIREMTGQLSGRRFIALRCRGGSINRGRSITYNGQVLIDIKDKWR